MLTFTLSLEARVASIPLSTKVLYGSGQVSAGVKDTAFNVFLLFYYTQVVGLSGSLAGAAIFIALLFDAISDPLVGFWSDRSKTRWGRRHPFMYVAALPMGVAFYFLFNPPVGEQYLLFTWMLVFAVLVRLFMTFYQVPSSALVAEMTSNYDLRTTLASFRVLAGWLGGLAFSVTGYLVFFAPTDQYEDGRLNPEAYQEFALLGGGVIVLAILVCALGTHYLIPQLREVAENAGESGGLKKDLTNMLHNRQFLILAGVVFVSASATGFTDVINLYIATYFWELTTDQLALLTIIMVLGPILAFSFAPRLSARFDKKPVALVTMVIVGGAYPSLIGMRLLGILPENGDPMLFVYVSIMAVVVVTAGVTLTMLFASMIADTIDKNELQTGQRQEAIYNSATSLSFKATSGIGGFVAGILLDVIDFPAGAEAAEVSQATLNSLGFAVAGIIVCFWTLAFLVMRLHSLSREDHAQILAELEERKAST